MKIQIFILPVCALLLAACQPNVPTNSVSSVEKNVNQTIKPLPTVAPDKSKIKTYDGTGKVTKINLEIGSVELDHEEIKGAMPAMLMEFYVSDKKMLDGLKVGDKVVFVMEDNAGVEQIIKIKRK